MKQKQAKSYSYGGVAIVDDNVKNNWLSAKKCVLVQDIEKLYKKIEKMYPPKGKFEKTKDYIKRVSKIKHPIYCISVDSYTLDYDPDSEKLNFKMSFDNYGRRSTGVCCISGKKELVFQTKYVAKNAFGATAIVHSSFYEVYGICIENCVKNMEEIKGDSFCLCEKQIKIPLKKAKVLFDNPKEWKLMIAFTPKPMRLWGSGGKPYEPTFVKFDHIRPTFSSPFERSIAVYGINASIVRIWLYNPVKRKLIILFEAKKVFHTNKKNSKR